MNSPPSPSSAPDERQPGRYALEGLDRTIHEKARLGILTSLLTRPEGLLFNELKELCALTDGNLNRHLKVLDESGLVEIWKGYRNNRPQTLVRITAQGRQRFTEYLTLLEQLVADAVQWTQPASEPATDSLALPGHLGLQPG